MAQSTRWIPGVLIGLLILLNVVWGYKLLVERGKMESRLHRLEDREEIRGLLMNYGQCLDRRDFVAFSKLFSERQGEWIGGLGRAQSAPAIRKLMEDTIGKNSSQANPANRHVFTNEMINVHGDQAQALTKWMFLVQATGGMPQPVYLGHYEDSFIRENGRWKFLRRVVYGDIPPDNPGSPQQGSQH